MSGIVQFTRLGKKGGFGNQMFQYAFARSYAEEHGATFECPEWIGDRIFSGVKCQRPSVLLPYNETDTVPDGKVNIDLFGYYQTAKAFNYLNPEKLKKWFKIKKELLPQNRSEVVAHLRRGDYVKYSNEYALVIEQSYEKTCKKYEIKPKIKWILNEKNPADEIDIISDFVDMATAKVLLRANSTFSFWAGFLNTGRVFAPVLNGKTGYADVDFIEGNWPKICDLTDNMFFGGRYA